MKDRATIWISLAAGLLILAGIGYLTRERSLTGKNDFLSLYSGATLVGTPGLFSMTENQKVHHAVANTSIDFVYFRPPFYAFLLKPLTWIPYRAAAALFDCLTLAATGWFLWRFGRHQPELFVFGVFSVAVYSAFVAGQDIGFALAIAAASILAMRRGQDTLAGLIFSLASIKFHLFLLVPLVFLIHRRWNVLKGGTIGAVMLTVISFAVAGLDWPVRYLEAMRNPTSHLAAENSATLQGAMQYLGGAAVPLLIVASLIVIALVIWIARSTPDTELALAAAVAGSFIVGFHAYTHDMVLLLLPFALVLERSRGVAVRATAALLASPILGLAVLIGAPYNLAVSIAAFAFLGAVALAPQGQAVQTTITRAEGLAS